MLSFQKAEAIYDITFRFCQRYLHKGDRTIDQMVQSARSGKQNIIEGSKAAGTSKEAEIRLTGVARASLEELLEDYRDYLRVRDLRLWDKDSEEARFVRELGRKTPLTFEDFREFVETRPPEVIANIAICVIHQATYLLDQQIRRLEKDFVQGGGLRERMTSARLHYRNQPHPPHDSQNSQHPRDSRSSHDSHNSHSSHNSHNSQDSHDFPPRKPGRKS